MGIIAVSEKDKYTNVNSKRRAGTKKAGFKVSADGIENAIANSIDASRRPDKSKVQTVGVKGPKQEIRVWKRTTTTSSK